MNKEQIDEIALRVANKSVDFQRNDIDSAGLLWEYTHALLAELAKVQEPIYLFRRKGFTDFLTCEYARLNALNNHPELFEVKIVYEHPLPQPDLVAENERLGNELKRWPPIVDAWHNTCEELRQQLFAAQASEAELLSAAHVADAAFRTAVIDELVSCHIYNQTHDTDPRKAIADAIAWNVDTALDPRISERALALTKQADDELLKALEQYSNVVTALYPVEIDAPLILLKAKESAEEAIATHKARKEGK